MDNILVVEGSEAVGQAIKACNPQVISAYPISPQTHIVETLAQMIADGDLNAQYVRVESEFSAASVVAGASAAGSRSYTVSSSQGLLLMTEVIYASAGMRLPFVLTGVNRSISAPINIQVDHQDTISLRDSGIIQFYVESVQEAYDMHLAAFKIAEDPQIMLPVMICMDGWVLTHSYERVHFLDQKIVDDFLPPYQPANYLNPKDPKTWGSYAEADVLMELKYAIHKAMTDGIQKIKHILKSLSTITGRSNSGLVEAYQTDGAEIILVAMGSMVGTIKDAIDELRSIGKKVGLIKIRCYRPFPFEDIWEVIKNAELVCVLDASFSMGSEGPISMDLKAKVCGGIMRPYIVNFIIGLGGREININTIKALVERAEDSIASPHNLQEAEWVDLNHDILL